MIESSRRWREDPDICPVCGGFMGPAGEGSAYFIRVDTPFIERRELAHTDCIVRLLPELKVYGWIHEGR